MPRAVHSYLKSGYLAGGQTDGIDTVVVVGIDGPGIVYCIVGRRRRPINAGRFYQSGWVNGAEIFLLVHLAVVF